MASTRPDRHDTHRFAAEFDLYRYWKTDPDIFTSNYISRGADFFEEIYSRHGATIPPTYLRYKHDLRTPKTLSNDIEHIFVSKIDSQKVTVRYRGINDGDQMTVTVVELTARSLYDNLPWSVKLSYAQADMDIMMHPNVDGKINVISLVFAPRTGGVPGLRYSPDAFPLRRLNIDVLPYEILIRTLSRLSPEELEGLCHSSIRWKGLCGRDSFWEDLIAENGWTGEAMGMSGSWKERYAFLHAGVTPESLLKIKRIMRMAVRGSLVYERMRRDLGRITVPLLLKFSIQNISVDDFAAFGEFINATRMHIDPDDKNEENIAIVIQSISHLLNYMSIITRVPQWDSYVQQGGIRVNFGWEHGNLVVHFIIDPLMNDEDSFQLWALSEEARREFRERSSRTVRLVRPPAPRPEPVSAAPIQVPLPSAGTAPTASIMRPTIPAQTPTVAPAGAPGRGGLHLGSLIPKRLQ